MYCPKCGTNINNGRYCHVCGHSLAARNADAGNGNSVNYGGASVRKPFDWKRYLPLFIILVGLVIMAAAVIILINVLSDSKKDAVEDYFNAIENQSASDMLSCAPDDYIADIMDDYDVSRKDILKALNKYLHDDWTSDWVYNYYEPGDDIRLEYLDENMVEKADLRSLFKYLKKIGTLKNTRFNPEMVEDADVYYVDFYDGDSRYKIIFVFKYRGKWYCSDALGLIEHAARLYG